MAERETDLRIVAKERASVIIEAYEAHGLINEKAQIDALRQQAVADILALYESLGERGPIELEPYIPISKLHLKGTTLHDLVVFDNHNATKGIQWWDSPTGTFVFSSLWDQYRIKELMPESEVASLVRGMWRLGHEPGDGLHPGYEEGDATASEHLRIDGLQPMRYLDPAAFLALSMVRRFEKKQPLSGFTHFPQLGTKMFGGSADQEARPGRPYAAALPGGVVLGIAGIENIHEGHEQQVGKGVTHVGVRYSVAATSRVV